MTELNDATEYIDKAKVLKLVEKYSPINGCGEGHYSGVADCIGEEIEDIPPADVAPVIHARWIDNGRGGYAHAYFCGNCGWIDGYPMEDRHKYCPNCGAIMDESEDEE